MSTFSMVKYSLLKMYPMSLEWREIFLSKGCIIHQGYDIEFVQNSCFTKETKTCEILKKRRRPTKRGFHRLNAHSIQSTMVWNLEIFLEIPKTLLWYKQLGHLNAKVLCNLFQEVGLLHLLKISYMCDICQMDTQPRKKFLANTKLWGFFKLPA